MRYRFAARSVAVAILALLAAPPFAAATASQAGQVLALFGPCFVETAGHKAPLKLGDPVHVGDAVEVAAGGKLKLRMEDGSIIAVASNSRLTIRNYEVARNGAGREAALSLAHGLLRAVVSSLKGRSHFEVDTATGVAAVRSTDWFIEAQAGSTQVGVLKGRVSLEGAATGRAVVIPAQWGARVYAGKDPTPPRKWSHAEFADVIRRTNLPR
ncbi:MAG TPA: FecR family protein [Stellaceae bacterium]|nr:FecR family protein [Stellaceae bacterium]